MLASLLLFPLLPGWQGGNVRQPMPKPPASVLLVIADDIASADLASVPTPNLARLAERGRVFARAYANPTCSPSRRSMFFSQWYQDESGEVCSEASAGLAPLSSRFP